MTACRRQSRLHWLLVLLFLRCVAAYSIQADNRIDVIVGNFNVYPAQIAFNNSIKFIEAANLNLMLPPIYQPQLCEYPHEELRKVTQSLSLQLFQHHFYNTTDNNTNYWNGNDTIAYKDPIMSTGRENMSVTLLLGNDGSCHPRQQAQIALELQRNFTSFGRISRLIIYKQDDVVVDDQHLYEYHVNSLQSLASLARDNYTSDKELEDIGVLFVTTRTGMDILEAIQEEVIIQGASFAAVPRIFSEGNELWYYPVSYVEPTSNDFSFGDGYGVDYNDNYNDNYQDPGYPPIRPTGETQPEADDFYWFRLVVFSLLVVSPCFRAAYLWYAGGARIRFRYNEHGRITGLQYIPPMPYWFAPRPEESNSHHASRMTREEVMALPEIVYRASEATEGPTTASLNDTSSSTSSEGDEEKGEPKKQQPSPEISENVGVNNSSGTVAATEEQAPAQPHQYSPEMSTTCSICIDDFEDGERLRMLPRCRHCFHTECLIPWLVERQGCCPLCKTEVIEPENDEEDDSSHQSHHYQGEYSPRSISQQLSSDDQQQQQRSSAGLSSDDQQQQQRSSAGQNGLLNGYEEAQVSNNARRSDPDFVVPPSVDVEPTNGTVRDIEA